MAITADVVIELSKEVESQDTIDWSYLSIDEDGVYNLIAMNVLEQYDNWQHLTSEQRELSMLAVITKLLVENFVVNVKMRTI